MSEAVKMVAHVERPILFSGSMVRAILAGTKTQTRRVVTSQNSLVNGYPPVRKGVDLDSWHTLDFSDVFVDNGPSPAGNEGPYMKVAGPDDSRHRVYSRVQRGDVFWVKETFRATSPDLVVSGTSVHYRADEDECAGGPWKPSIFMPRWASRIALEVTGVRVERVQAIGKQDAIAEGARAMLSKNAPWPASSPRWSMLYPHPVETDPADGHMHCLGSPQMAFANLWISLNGKREGCSWDANPWVWVYEFRRL